MKRKRAIKRFFLTLMWLGVAIGMGTIITAAIRVQEAGVCKGYDIKIQGIKEGMLFTSEDQILSLLKTAVKGEIKGQRKSVFKLQRIEDLLEQSAWVYNADLYFDSNDILHANVTERKPLARVFANNGASFYIDEAGKQIPLSDKVSLDLPVFTGYPSKKIMSGADSTLIQNVIATASFITGDPFWSAQVAQIDINSCGASCWNMEMVPVVGNHKVDLGDGSDIASKFHRLYLFYDQVLSRTGFDKYQRIDVQYNGQIIGKKGNYSKIDSIQLKKNIEQLLQQARAYNEMVEAAPALSQRATLPVDSLTNEVPDFVEENVFADSTSGIGNADEAKSNTTAQPVLKAATVAIPKKQTEKAVVAKVVEKKTIEKKVEKHIQLTENHSKKVEKKVVTKPTNTSTETKKNMAVKKSEVQKVTKHTATTKSDSKKIETKKVEIKKVAPAKVEAKRNLLSKPADTKKPTGKNTTTKKKD